MTPSSAGPAPRRQQTGAVQPRDSATEQPTARRPAKAPMRVAAIIPPDDGNDSGIFAVRWAVRGLLGKDDQLLLVSVLPKPFTSSTDRMVEAAYAASRAEISARDRDQASLQLQRAASEAIHLGVPEDRVFLHSSVAAKYGAYGVAEALSNITRTAGCLVVALVSHGVGGVRRLVMDSLGLGSVSSACVRMLAMPTAIVPLPAAGIAHRRGENWVAFSELRRAVVAVDGSAPSRECVEWAARTFGPQGTEIHLVAVSKTTARAQLEKATVALEAATKTVSELTSRAPETATLEGAPRGAGCIANALYGYIIDVKAHLLVVGSSGAGSGKRVLPLLGRTTRHAAHNAPCPVVIVTKKEEDGGCAVFALLG